MDNLLDQRKVGFLIGALVLAGVGIYFFQDSADRKDQEGKTALYQVQKNYEEETAALPEAERSTGAALDVDGKYSKTVAGLTQMLNEKKASSRILFEAVMKLANLYLDHNQTEKAVAVLKNVGDYAKSGFQKASGFYLLGVAHERLSQFKEASDAFDKGLSQNVDGLKGELFLGMVRTSLKLNDKGRAKLYLEKMNKEVAGSRAAETADEMVKGANT